MESTPTSLSPRAVERRGTTRREPRGVFRGCTFLCLLALLLSACRDSPTDPLEGLVAGETGRAALALELPLPAPTLASPDGEGAELLASWRSSWEEPVLQGRELRGPLYAPLARRLAESRPRAELVEEMALLGAGVRRAKELDPASLPEFLTAGIRRAESAWRRGERAVEAGGEERGWAELLLGSDALREVGPEAVARWTVTECEARLRRISADAPYSEKELDRIRHLVRGGRQALEDGDWGLAIRRAYYADGLLDGNG